MMNQSHFLILGANSLTGKSLMHFFSKHHCQYSISDIHPHFLDSQEYADLETKPIFIYDIPQQDHLQLFDIDIIILSPGFPRSSPIVKAAEKKSIPVFSEITFSLNYLKSKNLNPTILGITGSNGKSTTCALLQKMIESCYDQEKVFLLGNFGIPVINYVDQIKSSDILILELSSYQLEDAENYHLHGAGIVNITPNHLDRYPSFEEYKKTKWKIADQQKSDDFIIINHDLVDDPHLKTIQSQIISVKDSQFQPSLMFSMNSEGDIFHYNHLLVSAIDISPVLKSMRVNILIVLAFIDQLGFPLEKALSILKDFKGLEHRSEWVSNINEITVINDSKATTPEAVLLHLKYSSDKKIVLILGGKNKNLDFSLLKDFLGSIVHIVFYGESGKSLAEQISFSSQSYEYQFDKAVIKAYEVAKHKVPCILLLSTGCTSWDQFESYKKRGQRFKELIYEIQSS